MSDSEYSGQAQDKSSSAAIWYYAAPDQRQGLDGPPAQDPVQPSGPVPLEQLRALIQAGDVAPNDLIWREGMEDWEPASELPRLSSGIPPVHEPAERREPPKLLTRERLEKVKRAAETGARQGVHWLTRHTEPRTWVLVGLAFLFVARGCDTLADRGVKRQDARWQLAVSSWDAQAKRQRLRLQSKLDAADEDDERQKLEKELRELNAELVQQRRELEEDEWWELEQAVERAAGRGAMWGYWRQWLAMLGVGVLMVALGVIATSERTPDRVVAMVMLAILLWSLTVSGSIWE